MLRDRGRLENRKGEIKKWLKKVTLTLALKSNYGT